MKETSPFHGIPISYLMEPKTNRAKMAMVNDFVRNGILMFSLMERKTILTKMKMADDFQMKGQGVYYIVSFQIHHGA
jgi:hypothetical protein